MGLAGNKSARTGFAGCARAAVVTAPENRFFQSLGSARKIRPVELVRAAALKPQVVAGKGNSRYFL